MRHFVIVYLSTMLLAVPLGGQSLAEQMGGIRTNFILTSDSVSLETDSQILIKRAISDSKTELIDDGSAKYGYGYQSYHLEFICNQDILVHKGIGKSKSYYLLELFDGNHQLLASIKLKDSDVQMVSNQKERSVSAYSINLRDIPLVLLDRALEVNLVKHVHKRYW